MSRKEGERLQPSSERKERKGRADVEEESATGVVIASDTRVGVRVTAQRIDRQSAAAAAAAPTHSFRGLLTHSAYVCV